MTDARNRACSGFRLPALVLTIRVRAGQQGRPRVARRSTEKEERGQTSNRLAELIGTTRESINKELKVLRDKGMISTEGGIIKIIDLERLKRRIH